MYKLEYLFKSSESAWKFINGNIVTLDDIYIEDEIWPNNRINPLNKRKRFEEDGRGKKYISKTRNERRKIESYYKQKGGEDTDDKN